MIKVNGYPVEPINFPAGEVGVRLTMDHIHQKPTNLKGHYNVSWEFESPSEYFVLAQLIDALKNSTLGIHKVKIDLFIPYFPFARQDRIVNKGEANALRVFCNALNNLDIETIVTYDPHSLAVEQHFDPGKFSYVTQEDVFVMYAPEVMKLDIDVVIAPDAGAAKKAAAIAKILDAELVQCNKVRDKLTGEVVSLKFDNLNSVANSSKVLVVDDICDGGATFIAVGKTIRDVIGTGDQAPDGVPCQVMLYTTHGIYSKGKTELNKYYTHIDCAFQLPRFK